MSKPLLQKTAQTKESRASMRKDLGALGKTNLGEGLNYAGHHPTTSEEILSKMGSSPSNQSPLIRAYLIGKKLAHADFNDNDNVEDGLNTHDNEVYHKVKAEDFVSPEDHGNMTPNTNDHSYGQTKNDEVVPEEEEGSIYQTTKIERRERHG